MSTDKYIRKQSLGYAIMSIIGVMAVIIGYGWDFEANVMSGIAIGFLPVGIGGLLIMLYSRNNPAISRNVQIESDERNVFIRHKSGSTALWITFWYVFALTMLANFVRIEAYQLGVLTLIFMGTIYFFLLYINNHKY